MFKAFLFLCLAVTVTTGLRCWECSNAVTNKKCLEDGRLRVCDRNEGSCQNTIRVSNGKMTLFKGCKQTQACKNNMRQNGPISAAWYPIQCSMQPQNTVCRCCCSTNGCNEYAFFCRGDSQRRSLQRLEEENHACGKPLCNNVGRCYKQGDKFKCACNRDFEGRQCQFRKNPLDIADGSDPDMLLMDQARYRSLDSDTMRLEDIPQEDINECEGINNGLGNCYTNKRNTNTCENTIGSFICHCNEGWVGLLCEERIEVHNQVGHVHVNPAGYE